ncbi:cytochrome P450 [Actinocrispum wychmicini]|uniref:Pimeloyl-[acyl-carrier protein] synthase n=1 Tax=Actinocrispum wychmicini TaxID=1213861 RepID=A0A4R2JV07_9PSEU|nr:cytochrome P450 [Actinocrispum wychmicini]TCO61126.1 pimeloyl-[acyl-carrier protein] synthase [Actinocrispum wychmicini]
MSQEWSVRAVVRRLLTRDGLADPYAVYREIRSAADAGAGTGRFLFRYADVREALYDRELSSDRVSAILRPLPADPRRDADLLEQTMRDIVVFRDGTEHRRLRKLLMSSFTPRTVTRARPLIEQFVDRLLDRMEQGAANGDPVDLHRGVTYPLPALVVAALLGVPDDDRDAFQSWALDLVLVVGSGEITPELAARANDSMRRMRELMARLVEQRRVEPGPDLLSAMIAASDDGERLTTDELYANALFLMTAGHETATNLLSNAVLTLLRHPDQVALLRADPSLLNNAVEEVLRFEGPVQIAARIADRDRTVCGIELKQGEPLVVMLGAANRDPDVFTDPDEFDITRSDNPHVAFAHGAHFCLGAALARAELQIVLPRILDRFPNLRLAEDEIEWQPTLDFRGPNRLLVVW